MHQLASTSPATTTGRAIKPTVSSSPVPRLTTGALPSAR